LIQFASWLVGRGAGLKSALSLTKSFQDWRAGGERS
jgi:hypothetical protein